MMEDIGFVILGYGKYWIRRFREVACLGSFLVGEDDYYGFGFFFFVR